jgi:hypothetical protein
MITEPKANQDGLADDDTDKGPTLSEDPEARTHVQ